MAALLLGLCCGAAAPAAGGTAQAQLVTAVSPSRPVVVGNRTASRLYFPLVSFTLGDMSSDSATSSAILLRAQTSPDQNLGNTDAVFASTDRGLSWRHVADEPVQKRLCVPEPAYPNSAFCIPFAFDPGTGAAAARNGSLWTLRGDGSIVVSMQDVTVTVHTAQPMGVTGSAVLAQSGSGGGLPLLLTPMYMYTGPSFMMLFEAAPPYTRWTPRANISAGWPTTGASPCDSPPQCGKVDPPACCKTTWMPKDLGDESALLRLSNGLLVLVFRDWNGSPVIDLYVRQLSITVSADDGRHWETPAPLLGRNDSLADPGLPPPHSVEPKLVRLDNGIVVLVSGRQGQWLWHTDEAMLMGTSTRDGAPLSAAMSARARPWAAAMWDSFNLLEWHNSALAGSDAGLLFPSVCVKGLPSSPVCSTYYTSVTVLPSTHNGSACTVLIAYDRTPNGRDPPTPGEPWGDVLFSVRLTLSKVPKLSVQNE